MVPPSEVFQPAELPDRVQVNAVGKRRKTSDGQKIDLRKCELLELVQYSCTVEQPRMRDAPIKCWPVQRLFRKYVAAGGRIVKVNVIWIIAVLAGRALGLATVR
jgi:hypothetical protein